MSLTEIVLLFILGLKPDWRLMPVSDRSPPITVARHVSNVRPRASPWRRRWAGYIVAEGERQSMEGEDIPMPFVVAAVAYREGSFRTGHFCESTVPRDRILRTEDVEDRMPGEDRQRLFFSYHGGKSSRSSS